MKQYMNFIDGEYVATAKTFRNRSPVDNRVLGVVHEAGATRSTRGARGARRPRRRVGAA
jgi:aminomuconate-semialdehyde/2-hydroxymuconate-6-semialdehyde dehydrogenase